MGIGSAAMLLGGGMLGAYLTLGMWLERGDTGLFGGLDYSGVPDPSWLQVLNWSNFRFWLLPMPVYHWYGGYLGLSVLLLALVGLLGAFQNRGRWPGGPYLAGGVCLLVAVFLVFGYRLPVLELRVVRGLNAGRYLLFVVFFLSLMAGVGVRFAGRRRAFVLLLLLLIVDLGPTTFQHPYPRFGQTPLDYPLSFYDPLRQAAAAYHRRDELPDYRISWLFGDLNPFLAMGRLTYMTGTPSPSAPTGHNLRTFSAFYGPFERFASAEFAGLAEGEAWDSAEHAELFRDILNLLNARYAIITRAEGELNLVRWEHHTPIVVAPRVEAFPAERLEALMAKEGRGWSKEVRDFYPIRWLIARMGVNRAESKCERIFLADFEGQRDLGTSPEVDLLEHRVWNQRVEVRVRVSEACFARLAYGYFPHLEVRVDGHGVAPLKTAGWFIGLELEGGEHRIVLEPRLSPLRRGLLVLNLVLLVAGTWGAVRERRTRRRRNVAG